MSTGSDVVNVAVVAEDCVRFGVSALRNLRRRCTVGDVEPALPGTNEVSLAYVHTTQFLLGTEPVSYTHLTLPTKRIV